MVRQLRLDAGLSQEELAQRAGMTQPALSRLERGDGIPTITLLARIANALQATLTLHDPRRVVPLAITLGVTHPPLHQ